MPPERTLGRHRRRLPRRDRAGSCPALPPDHIVGEPFGRDTAAVHRPGRRPDRPRRPRRRHARHAGRPRHRAGAGVPPGRPRRRADGRGTPDALVTFGIPPTFPATGYGYIHRGAEVAQRQGVSVYRVRGFKEKPPRRTGRASSSPPANTSGTAASSSGRPRPCWTPLRQQQPALYAAVAAHRRRLGDAAARRGAAARVRGDRADQHRLRGHGARASGGAGRCRRPYRWDDVGSWLALERMNPQDADGNTVLGAHCRPEHAGLRHRRRRGPADRHHRRRQPADRAGRQRHARRRPPRGGGRQAAGRVAQEEGAGEVPVSAGRSTHAPHRGADDP